MWLLTFPSCNSEIIDRLLCLCCGRECLHVAHADKGQGTDASMLLSLIRGKRDNIG